MSFGLSNKTLTYIIDNMKEFREIEGVKIYGSRALGNYKRGSDIDLALIGEDVNSFRTK